ncbi:MAG: MazG family protein [Desulfuromusa sp.]
MINPNTAAEVLRLMEIMATLRSPTGCPWDKKQTPESLKPYILEEAYELIEAIDKGETTDICDELGDLLLQIIFLAQIYSEQDQFGLAEVALSISNKMIRRHPHVFADASAENHAQRWAEIKRQERSSRGKGNKLADRIPINLPALKKATKVVKKIQEEKPVAQIQNIQQGFSDLCQLTEKALTRHEEIETLLGEILFRTVQLTSSLKVDAEDLLRKKTMQVISEIDI